MAENITIQFKATGGTALKKTIDTIYAANVRLTKGQKEYDKVVKKLNSTNKKLENSQKRLRRSTSTLTKAQKKAQAGLLGMGHAARNTAGAFSVLRSQMLLASFGAALVVKPMIDMANAAAKAEETLNKANVVFGRNIDIVQRWAEALGNSVGRASSTLMEMASTLQDTFVPLGFTRDAATKLSTSLTKLALDIASFNNKADADVVRDFQSAIVGNHETVRKYGIVLSESGLKLEAYRLGILKGSGELTNAAKVQARLSLIMKGSKDAMGDLDRTQDSYANTVKRFNEHWKEVAETLGKRVQPILRFFMDKLMNPQALKAYAISLGLVASGFALIKKQAIMAAFATATFSKAVTRTGIGGIVIGLGYLIEKFLLATPTMEDFNSQLKDAEDIIDNFKIETEKAADASAKLREQQEKSVISLRTKLDLLYATSEAEKILLNLSKSREGGMANVTQAEIALARAISERKEVMEVTNKISEDELLIFDQYTKKSAAKIQQVRDEATQMELSQTRKKFSLKFDQDVLRGDEIVLRKKIEINDANIEALRKLADEKNMHTVFDKKVRAELEKMTEDSKNWNDILVINRLEQVNLGSQINITKIILEKLGIIVDDTSDSFIALTEAQKEVMDNKAISNILSELGGATGGVSFDMSGMIESFNSTYAEVLDMTKETTEASKAAWMELAAAVGAAMIQAQMAASQARIASIKEGAQADIAAFKSTERYNKMSTKQKKAFEAEKLATANKAIKKQFENQQKMQRAGVIMNTAAAIMGIWADVPKVDFGVSAGVLTGLVTAMGLMQLEAINSQQAPTMAKGGLIGGKFHSQGGTMINAERGEYVMSRDAVDAVGVETMNRINQGGGGSAINVSFTGNVMSDEFLESEAIPKIKEAIRRGADIGLS